MIISADSVTKILRFTYSIIYRTKGSFTHATDASQDTGEAPKRRSFGSTLGADIRSKRFKIEYATVSRKRSAPRRVDGALGQAGFSRGSGRLREGASRAPSRDRGSRSPVRRLLVLSPLKCCQVKPCLRKMPMGERHWAHTGSVSSGPSRSSVQGSAASRIASKVSGAKPIRNARAKVICSAEVAASRFIRSCEPSTGTGCATKSRGFMIDLMVIPPGEMVRNYPPAR